MNKIKQMDVGKLYRLLQQIDENKKWRKKHKEKGQLTIEQAINKKERLT